MPLRDRSSQIHPQPIITKLYSLRLDGCRFAYEMGKTQIEITSKISTSETYKAALENEKLRTINEKIIQIICPLIDPPGPFAGTFEISKKMEGEQVVEIKFTIVSLAIREIHSRIYNGLGRHFNSSFYFRELGEIENLPTPQPALLQNPLPELRSNLDPTTSDKQIGALAMQPQQTRLFSRRTSYETEPRHQDPFSRPASTDTQPHQPPTTGRPSASQSFFPVTRTTSRPQSPLPELDLRSLPRPKRPQKEVNPKSSDTFSQPRGWR